MATDYTPLEDVSKKTPPTSPPQAQVAPVTQAAPPVDDSAAPQPASDPNPAPAAEPAQEPAPQQASAIKTPESEPHSSAMAEVRVEPTHEKKLSPEVAEYITQHDEKIKVPEVLKQIGIDPAPQDEEIDLTEGPTMPMTDQQISDGLKRPMNTSVRWLSLLLLYLLQQAHYTIKTVHGQVKRVIKP